MSQTEIGLIGCVIVVVLILMGTHLALTLLIAGFIGFGLIGGWQAALGNLAIIPFDRMSNYSFTVFPMFMLMGALVSYGGIGKEAYEMARTWFGQFKGGLAIATVGACGMFAAVSGSSLAGSIVMGKVSYPEMRRAGYAMPLAAGVISAGGTLGILIPPSMGFILIGIMADMDIGKLFMAGILPGITEIIFYMSAIAIVCKINPKAAPSGIKTTWKQKMGSLKLTWPVVALFLLVMGGIYGGVFTVTEAGAIGALGAFLIPLARRQMSRRAFWDSLMDTARMMGMIIVVLAGVFLFNAFLAITQLPNTLGEFLVSLPVSRWVVLVAILMVYIILGCFFDVIAILILTIPILYPAIAAMGFDMIWYSVIMVRIIEIGEITPPFGINLFGLRGVIDAPLGTIYRGVLPFVIADLLDVALLCAVPAIATFLPYHMM
jgi:tripartite ATP-independent transporter DctM subunit